MEDVGGGNDIGVGDFNGRRMDDGGRGFGGGRGEEGFGGGDGGFEV